MVVPDQRTRTNIVRIVLPCHQRCERCRRPTKPFLRVVDALGGAAAESEWLCGDGLFTVRVSPPIEAQPIETIVIDARGCGIAGCSDDVSGASATQRSVDIDVASVAEELICGSLPGTAQPLVACADIFGDSTPEVFMLTTGGQACAFLGNEQRFGGPLPANGTVALPFAPDPVEQPPAEQLEPPLTVNAFEWFDDIANVTKAVVLGRFAGEPFIRRLRIADKPANTGQTVEWLAAPEMQFLDADDIPLHDAQPVSSDKSKGASHLAFFERVGAPADWTLHVRCVSGKSADGTTACVDTSLNFGQVGLGLAGFTAADIDGDGDRDLAYFVTSGPGPIFLLNVVLIELDWTTPGEPTIGAIATIADTIPLLGDEVVATAVPGANGPEDIYVVFDPDIPVANMIHIRGKLDAFVAPPSAGPDDTIATPGPALGVVGTDSGLIVSLQLGTWELTHDMGGAPLWRLADPVLQEAADAGSLSTPPDGYGRALARCIADPEAVMFTSDQRTARYTQLGLVITDP